MLDTATKVARLRAACERGRIDFNELVRDAEAGECQFHEFGDSVAVTSLLVSGAYRVCYILVAAGSMKDLCEAFKIVDTFARENGCTHVRTVGRPGFTKHYQKLDPEAKIVGVMFEKVL